MGVMPILHTNTVHLKESTYELLNEDAVYHEAECPSGKNFQFMNVYHLGKYGHLLDIDESSFIEASKTQEIPHDLVDLVESAIVAKCYTIRLDDDGEHWCNLPKYVD